MVPSNALYLQWAADSVAANSTFGGATLNVKLSKSGFSPNDGAGFVEADFDGYSALSSPAWANGQNPVSLLSQFTLTPPSGGFRWVAGANITAPQAIFGYQVYDISQNITMGGATFSPPITINEAGQQLVLDTVELSIQPNALG
jgi:hypothetical protein